MRPRAPADHVPPFQSLIAAVESGAHVIPDAAFAGTAFASGQPASDFAAAYLGSLDAVVRLEAPLRERGWLGPAVMPGTVLHVAWELYTEDHRAFGADPSVVEGGARTEARARLLAVLGVLSHEAQP